MLRSLIAAFAMVLALVGVAAAHPHVFITGKTTVLFENGAIVGVRHVWSFDDAYSAFAVQGLDANGDGEFSEDELRELAEVNIESLKDFGYFTFAGEGEDNVEFGDPLPDYRLVMKKIPIEDYWLLSDDDRAYIREQAAKENTPELLDVHYLEMTVTIPLVEPYQLEKKFEVDVYDPNYYIAYSFAKDGGTALDQAPAGCRVEMQEAGELDDATAAALAAIPATQQTPP
ncbi:MAG TPA: DUF1007 family protein, partial [Hyphomicrobiales bacterium]|nr:DUF1007 family protein [Hyphomicrobiales bacterium]